MTSSTKLHHYNVRLQRGRARQTVRVLALTNEEAQQQATWLAGPAWTPLHAKRSKEAAGASARKQRQNWLYGKAADEARSYYGSDYVGPPTRPVLAQDLQPGDVLLTDRGQFEVLAVKPLTGAQAVRLRKRGEATPESGHMQLGDATVWNVLVKEGK